MADSARESNRDTGYQERYTHGYSQYQCTGMSDRKSDIEGAFLLPHLKPGMSLLDCGCGPGSITIGLARVVTPGNVVGIDIGPAMIEQAQANARNEDLENIGFEVASTYELPFPDESFDVVFSNAMLEHLREPLNALTEMKRVLKRGGLIGLRDSDWGGTLIAPADPLVEEFLALREKVWQSNGGNSRLGRHLKSLLTETGFIQIEHIANYQHFEAERIGQSMRQYASSADFAGQVIEQGLGDETALNRYADAAERWRRKPDAFFAYAVCHAIGWKR